MKKLMIVAAFAMAAVAANAAKFDWGFQSLTDLYTPQDESSHLDMPGYTAYLVSKANWNAADKTSAASIGEALALAIATAPSGLWKPSEDNGYWPDDGDTYFAYTFTKAESDIAKADSDIGGKGVAKDYFIIFDNGEKFADFAVTGDILANDDNSQGYKKFGADLGKIELDQNNFTSYGSVPEPTSGLLLLLGVAGLALRRRRA